MLIQGGLLGIVIHIKRRQSQMVMVIVIVILVVGKQRLEMNGLFSDQGLKVAGMRLVLDFDDEYVPAIQRFPPRRLG